MPQYKPIRKVFLFGAPGGEPNNTQFLVGVEKDLRKMKLFLQSDEGGAWLSSEIVIKHEATVEDVTSTLHSCEAEFVFVYVSGHGYSDSINNYVALQDIEVPDTFFLNDNLSRQIVLVDACRNYLREPAAISGISEERDWHHADGGYSLIREVFNNHILSSPPFKRIIHAVPRGFPTDDSLVGGVFTHHVLQVAKNYIQPDPEAIVYSSIDQIIYFITQHHLYHNRINNLPCITFSQGPLYIPFAFALPDKPAVRRESHPSRQMQHQNGTNWPGVGTAALVLLGVALVVDSEKNDLKGIKHSH